MNPSWKLHERCERQNVANSIKNERFEFKNAANTVETAAPAPKCYKCSRENERFQLQNAATSKETGRKIDPQKIQNRKQHNSPSNSGP